jgi:2-(1,2-epoxy-1,2-dihydrophenyl)acetyl-CoA isomerase
MDPLRLEISDGIATVELNRPTHGSALDLATLRAPRAAADQLAGTPGVRVVLLRSRGPIFCVGGDLRWMTEQRDQGTAVHTLATELHGALLALRALDAPIITVVQGTTVGAGVGLVASADIALAAESTTFVMAYTKVGLSPDGGSTWPLPRLIGAQRAAALMLLNTQMSSRGRAGRARRVRGSRRAA